METRNNTISIAQNIAPIVSSRDLVRNLEKDIAKKQDEQVNLDFTHVEFISRSAAHEFITLQERMKAKRFHKKEVLFVNVNDDVKRMLRVIAANKAMPEAGKPSVHLEKTDIHSLMATST